MWFILLTLIHKEFPISSYVGINFNINKKRLNLRSLKAGKKNGIFIRGPGGTGKSTLIGFLVKYLTLFGDKESVGSDI